MFFTQEREHFFRPLASKRREIVVGCLKAFHDKLYGSDPDEAYHLTREVVRDMFVQVIRATPIESYALPVELAEELDDMGASDERTFAGGILRLLIHDGWIEEFSDKAAVFKAFRFTRTGKAFATVFATLGAPRLRTRQRNVRSVRNCLQSFLRTQDAYDLADAYNFSRQVVEDFDEDIAYLYEARKELIKQAAEKRALDFYITYVEKNFVHDMAVRFSADSVERHRYHIADAIDEIRALGPSQLERANTGLLSLIPDSLGSVSDTPVNRILDSIEHQVTSACNSKVPELRSALSAFVKRANLIVHQASAPSGGLVDTKVSQVLGRIGLVDRQEQDRLLCAMARDLAYVQVRLVDPGALKPRRRPDRGGATTVFVLTPPTREQLLDAAIQKATAEAFETSPQKIKERLLLLIAESGDIAVSNLLVSDAPSAILATHAIEAAAVDVEPISQRLTVKSLSRRVSNPYFSFDDFLIQRHHD